MMNDKLISPQSVRDLCIVIELRKYLPLRIRESDRTGDVEGEINNSDRVFATL